MCDSWHNYSYISGHLADAFVQSDLQTVSHSYTDGMQGASCSSGAIWGSVSCSRMLQHAARGSWDSNQQPSNY